MAVFLGVLLTLGDGVDRAIIPLLAAGPPVAGLGIAYAFRAGPGMRELEQSCALDLFDATLGRLVLILTYDVGLLLLGSVALRLAGAVPSLPLLVLAWLAPLCFVSWVKNGLRVLSTRRTERGITARVLAAQAPIPGAVQLESTLEDSYMYLLGGDAS